MATCRRWTGSDGDQSSDLPPANSRGPAVFQHHWPAGGLHATRGGARRRRRRSSLHALLDHQLWIKLALHGEILHVNDTWSAARYHPGAKNWARAPEFGREAFRYLEWESQYARTGARVSADRAAPRASAHRVDARYLGGWGTALGGSEGLGPGVWNSSADCSCAPRISGLRGAWTARARPGAAGHPAATTETPGGLTADPCLSRALQLTCSDD